MKVRVGFCIQRQWIEFPPGKTMTAWSHQLYPERFMADDTLARIKVGNRGDRHVRFEYQVVEVFMEVEDPT